MNGVFFSSSSVLRQQQLLWPTYWLVNRHTLFLSHTHTHTTHGCTHVPTYFMHVCLWIKAFIHTHYNVLNGAWTLVLVTTHQSPVRHYITAKPVGHCRVYGDIWHIHIFFSQHCVSPLLNVPLKKGHKRLCPLLLGRPHHWAKTT